MRKIFLLALILIHSEPVYKTEVFICGYDGDGHYSCEHPEAWEKKEDESEEDPFSAELSAESISI